MSTNKEKVIVFVYVNPKNKKYLEKLSLSTNQPVSTCADAILDSARLGKKLKLKVKVNKAVAKFEAVQERKRQKIESMTI